MNRPRPLKTKVKVSKHQQLLPIQEFIGYFVSLLLSLLQVVVDIVEEVETNPANGLLFHHRLVENPAQDVGYDGRRVLNSLSKIKGFHKVYIIKVAQKQKKKN